jgi:large subunit ribosomal protein L22
MESKASLKYTMVGAQKARLVVDTVRGKSVDEALKILLYMNKKTAMLVKKLIESAVANAENKKNMNMDKLFIKSITVDQGPVLKRFRPRAQGRAFGVRKKLSHINVIIGENK